MTDEFKNRVIDDIKKTGFPVELKISSILRSQSWQVEQNGSYTDLEQNKSREIDISARKSFYLKPEKHNFNFAINLLIEAKKSEKRPWVFFMTPYKQKIYSGLFGPAFLGPAFGQIIHSENFTTQYLSAQSLMAHFPRNTESEISTSYYEAFKSPDSISSKSSISCPDN
jgi:hypothetical protein